MKGQREKMDSPAAAPATTDIPKTFYPKPGDNNGGWQVFWLVSAQCAFPCKPTQWPCALRICPAKPGVKLTAAGTAPDLHRCSLFIPIQRTGNQLPGAKIGELWGRMIGKTIFGPMSYGFNAMTPGFSTETADLKVGSCGERCCCEIGEGSWRKG